MKTKTYRQGDVLLIKADDDVPAGDPLPREQGKIVLAHGEATGHSHAIADAVADLFAAPEGRLLVARGVCSLMHEEHDRIDIPAGSYRVVIQREYSPEEIRNVQD